MKDQNSSKEVNVHEILYGPKNDQFQPFFQPKVQNSTKTSAYASVRGPPCALRLYLHSPGAQAQQI